MRRTLLIPGLIAGAQVNVDEERREIPEIIAKWNYENSESKKVVLLPIRWETHAAPLLGVRTQEHLNDQIVRGCDMLIGVFWTRIGTHTGVAQGGTVEEIEWCIDNGKPAMLYFSSKPAAIQNIDVDQFKALREFEEKMKKIGLTGSYENIVDFRERLQRQITINVDHLIIGKRLEKLSPDAVENKAEELKKNHQ